MVASDASQKVAIVTGASSGIGLYTALGLARAGMRVIMTGRNRDRTDAARDFVTTRVGDAQIETALADFASLAAVRRLADEILSRHQRIDVLINNAGLLSPSYRLSEDGYEMTFAVNHLAPFLLTNLLLDRLKASAPARVVTVSSRAHRGERIDLATIAGSQGWSMQKGLWPIEAVQHPVHSRTGAAGRRRRRCRDVPASRCRRDRLRPARRCRRTRLAAGETVYDQRRKRRRDPGVSGDGARPHPVPRRLRRQQETGAPRPGGARRRHGTPAMGGERAPRQPVSRSRQQRRHMTARS